MRPVALVVALAALSALSVANADACMHPRPAANFNNSAYEGTWYEIGKIQTWGGAIFESECVCTQILVSPAANASYTVVNSCRQKTPEGPYLNATGQLVNEGPAGRWDETFFDGLSRVNYTIIFQGDDYSVEYDCGSSFLGIVNYCIHVLSRTPTMDPNLFNSLVNQSIALGLNTQDLPVKMTQQDGCLRGSQP